MAHFGSNHFQASPFASYHFSGEAAPVEDSVGVGGGVLALGSGPRRKLKARHINGHMHSTTSSTLIALLLEDYYY